MQAYSLLITSCDRHDLLEKTVQTFLRTADIQPRQIVIVEDGPAPMPAFLNKYKHLGLKWINNGVRRGQIYSCDRLWQECKHDYAMWMEDDWAFTSGDFIKKSFDILEHPEVLTVTLRGDWNHPLVTDPRFAFKIAQPNWKGGWGGFCFNPGLRRKADWEKIGSYGKVTGYGTHGLGHEMDLSKLYASLGYVLAALPDRCSHIGGGRSRAIEPLETNPPKVLIAVPACYRFDYGPWESGESPHFDKSKAWQGEPYGTDIHISGDNPRISAVRETWARDVTDYKNATLRFFYGHGPNQPLKEDEVRLSVPDDYGHLPQKTIAICQWALDNGFEYTLKCDDDSYVYVDRAMTEVCQIADFAGYINGGSCSGGCGYWLSRRAMEAVVKQGTKPDCWAEDVWVGKCMKAANISPVNLPSHQPGFSAHWFFPQKFEPSKLHSGLVCIHAVQPEMMRAIYKHEHPTV